MRSAYRPRFCNEGTSACACTCVCEGGGGRVGGGGPLVRKDVASPHPRALLCATAHPALCSPPTSTHPSTTRTPAHPLAVALGRPQTHPSTRPPTHPTTHPPCCSSGPPQTQVPTHPPCCSFGPPQTQVPARGSSVAQRRPRPETPRQSPWRGGAAERQGIVGGEGSSTGFRQFATRPPTHAAHPPIHPSTHSTHWYATSKKGKRPREAQTSAMRAHCSLVGSMPVGLCAQPGGGGEGGRCWQHQRLHHPQPQQRVHARVIHRPPPAPPPARSPCSTMTEP